MFYMVSHSFGTSPIAIVGWPHFTGITAGTIPPLPPPAHSSFMLPTSLLLVSIPSICHFAPILRTLLIFKLNFLFKPKYFSKSFLKFNAINEILAKIPISSCCQKKLPKPTKTKHMPQNLPLLLYAVLLVFSALLSNLLRKSYFPSPALHCFEN